MRCRHFFSFALVAFLSFFFGSFIITDNTFAVDDITYTVNQSNYTQFLGAGDFCGSGSGVNCSDYTYFIFDAIDISNLPNFRISYFYTSSLNASLYVNNNLSSLIFSGSFLRIYLYQFPSVNSDFSFTFTLSNSLPGSTAPPSGNIDITSNGTYDVTNYATATVDVPAQVIQGDYHDDLISINHSILVCGAILLVLYFFYCIYRLIIKNSGVH